MRTKTLLLSAAALAAGMLSSFASSSNVYSVNIVGYVNKTTPLGFNAVGNPLISGTNGANQIYDNSAGAYDGSALYIWNGVAFVPVLFDSSSPTGFTDSGGVPVPAPALAPGTGFLFNNQVSPTTLTYVGQVTGVITNDPQLIASLTLPASPINQFITSPIPIGGGIGTALQLPVLTGELDGDSMQTPIIVGGNLVSFTVYLFDSSAPSGVTDAIGNPVAEPVIPVAGAFLFQNNNAVEVIWTQVIDLGP